MAEYVNVHGQPVGVSTRDAVLALWPDAHAHRAAMRVNAGEAMLDAWVVKVPDYPDQPVGHQRPIGSGASEEAAWRAAWSAALAEDHPDG